jgi:hypothetical protein
MISVVSDDREGVNCGWHRMARVLIVGYGNPLKSDDSLGWRASEEIVRQLSSSKMKVMRVHQLAPELRKKPARPIWRFSSMPEKGNLREKSPASRSRESRLRAQPTRTNSRSRPSYSWPGSFTDGAHVLTCSTVSGECFEDGETLLRAVAAALPELVARVKTLIS